MTNGHSEVGSRAGEPPRPAWVWRHGARRDVLAIEVERQEPGRRVYRVRLDSGERLLLIWREAGAVWSVTPVTPPLGPPSA